MAKMSAKGLMIFALILSLATSALIYSYLKKASVPVIVDKAIVITARVDIAPRTIITKEMITAVEIPVRYIQPGAIKQADKVIGVLTKQGLVAGEQIVERRLQLGDQLGLAANIPAGRRAFTIAVNEFSGMAGFVKPGDYVDVVATFDKSIVGEYVSSTLLQNIMVLAANRTAEQEKSANQDKKKSEQDKMVSITLAVTPYDVVQLALAMEKGRIHLALRPHLAPVGDLVIKRVTPTDIIGEHYVKADTNKKPTGVTEQASSKGREVTVIRGGKVETVSVSR